jgi:urocanate hydratase
LSAPNTKPYQPIRAPQGATLSCKAWPQEAALRLLSNSLDPDVAEQPRELIICGSAGKAAQSWDELREILAALQSLESGQTLLVHSGKPLATLQTRDVAPRVLVVNANWTYTGMQSALPQIYEVFRAAARKHFGGSLTGRLVVAGGMGGMGGAQPLAATLNGAAFLGIDIDPERIKRRVKSGYCDVMVNALDEALRILKNAVRKREASSVGLIGNCAEIIPELARRGVLPDLLTDQTSADDPLGGYIPRGLTIEEAKALQREHPEDYRARALDSIGEHVLGMLDLQKLGAITFESGNHIRAQAVERGVQNARDIPDGFSEYLEPAFVESGLTTLVALSGDPRDVARIDRTVLELFPDHQDLQRWIAIAGKHIHFQGLPARSYPLVGDAVTNVSLAVNHLVARGELKAPIAISRSSLKPVAAAAASKDAQMPPRLNSFGDWPAANSLLDAASGASMAWLRSIGSDSTATLNWGVILLADGTAEMAERMGHSLSNAFARGIESVLPRFVGTSR